MRTVTLGMSTALLLLAASAGNTQETLLDHLVDACKTDIENYCSQVTPGEGRMLHCMAAHEDKISGRCEYAFYQAATLLEQVSAAVNYLASQCGADIEKHCGEVELGEGRVLACLDAHHDELADSCKDAIDDTVAE